MKYWHDKIIWVLFWVFLIGGGMHLIGALSHDLHTEAIGGPVWLVSLIAALVVHHFMSDRGSKT